MRDLVQCPTGSLHATLDTMSSSLGATLDTVRSGLGAMLDGSPILST
ncbi:MAG: hypothetical protein WBO88_08350 [Candidatus Dechloromonas phosphoritropha]